MNVLLTPHRHAGAVGRWALLGALALTLAACGNKPPVPDWKVNSVGSVERATDAQLSGKTRVAEQEWSKARSEVARTGSPEKLARVELMRCAAQVAAANLQPCTAFDTLRKDAAADEVAYAAYLAGQPLSADQIARLPEPQEKAVRDVKAIEGIADPLSRLVAAGAALSAGRATPDTLVTATDTASEQGWSQALMGWLALRAERARAIGDLTLEAALRRRMDLIERQGKPEAAPAALDNKKAS